MLNSEALRQAIHVGGERIQLLRALPCSCYNPSANYDQQRGCERCEHGFVYQSNTVGQGLVTQQKHVALHPEFGIISQAQLYLTTCADEVQFGPFDKVRLLDRTALARERAIRGADELPHAAPVAVLQVADTEYAELPLYAEGTDFELVDNYLRWVSPLLVARGGGPPFAAARYPGIESARGMIPPVAWQIGPSETYAVEYAYTATYWYAALDLRPPRPTLGTGATGFAMPLTPQRGMLTLAPPAA